MANYKAAQLTWNGSTGFRSGDSCLCGNSVVDGFCLECDNEEIEQRNERWKGPEKKKILETKIAVVWTDDGSKKVELTYPKRSLEPFGRAYRWYIVLGTPGSIAYKRAEVHSLEGSLSDIWLFLEKKRFIDNKRNELRHRRLIFPEVGITPTRKNEGIEYPIKTEGNFQARRLFLYATQQVYGSRGHKRVGKIPDDVNLWSEGLKVFLLAIYYGSHKYKGRRRVFHRFGFLDVNFKFTKKGFEAIEKIMEIYKPRLNEAKFLQMRKRISFWTLVSPNSSERQPYWYLPCPTCSRGMSFERSPINCGFYNRWPKPPGRGIVECPHCLTIITAKFHRRKAVVKN